MSHTLHMKTTHRYPFFVNAPFIWNALPGYSSSILITSQICSYSSQGSYCPGTYYSVWFWFPQKPHLYHTHICNIACARKITRNCVATPLLTWSAPLSMWRVPPLLTWIVPPLNVNSVPSRREEYPLLAWIVPPLDVKSTAFQREVHPLST